jgi:hypothetical protein
MVSGDLIEQYTVISSIMCSRYWQTMVANFGRAYEMVFGIVERVRLASCAHYTRLIEIDVWERANRSNSYREITRCGTVAKFGNDRVKP